MPEVNPLPPELSGHDIEPLERADEELYATQAPTGNFTKAALNGLVTAVNKLLPLFSQTPDYPMFKEDVGVLPTDFVRVLSMFIGAVDAALAAEVIEPELAFVLEDIVDDTTLHQVAGKITSLAKSKAFKKFLNEPVPAPVAPVTPPVSSEPSPVDIDALFEERL